MATTATTGSGSTMAEKMLARHAGRDRVTAGELIDVHADVVMANDVTGPLAIKDFEQIGIHHVFDPQKVIFVSSHFTPAKDIQSAQQISISAASPASSRSRTSSTSDAAASSTSSCQRRSGRARRGDRRRRLAHVHVRRARRFATGMGSTDIAAAFVLGEVWLQSAGHDQDRLQRHAGPDGVTRRTSCCAPSAQLGIDGATYRAIEYHGATVDELSITGRITMANMAIEAGAEERHLPRR